MLKNKVLNENYHTSDKTLVDKTLGQQQSKVKNYLCQVLNFITHSIIQFFRRNKIISLYSGWSGLHHWHVFCARVHECEHNLTRIQTVDNVNISLGVRSKEQVRMHVNIAWTGTFDCIRFSFVILQRKRLNVQWILKGYVKSSA